MKSSACVDAPVHVVWAHLSALDQIHLWTDVIHRVEITSACAVGVGAERACELAGDRVLHERVIAWEDGSSFTYESRDAPMMAFARNRWSVRAEGDRTLVTSEADVVFRGGWLGRLAGYLLIPLIGAVLPNPLAKFKYWVENGRPFQGSARALPIPAIAC